MYTKKYFLGLATLSFLIMMALIFQTRVFAHQNSDKLQLLAPSPTIIPSLEENKNPLPENLPTAIPLSNSPIYSPSSPEFVFSDPSVSPERITATLNPSESYTAEIQVFTGDTPVGKGDILFVFDRTSSMGAEILQVKSSSVQIMNEVRAQLPNSWFGVGSFMDYPGYYEYPGYSAVYGNSTYGDVPWELNINPTDNITDVANTINNIWLGFGEDWPEDYTRALYETTSIGWRQNTKKVVVLFGDAPTHDLDFSGYNFGGDPGVDNLAQTSDDLDFETVVQQLAENDISVIAVDSGYEPESEATFKGMSIGFASASGTNGHYFHLDDASDIPGAVVQLIREETQQLDRLSLKVTEGYESWVQITPPEYTDVISNTTKTFNLVITVPDGVPSGFYPFVVQAIGDGLILGFSYVEVTVPTETPISDLGFRPNEDGFQFVNESATQSWEMFRQFFGVEQVEYLNGNRIQAADTFYQEHYRNAGDGGNCDGFSATSLLNYKGLTQPNAGEFALPNYTPLFSEPKTDDIWEAIAFAQGIQMGLEVNAYRQSLCTVMGNSPGGFYQYIKSQIQNNSPVTVGIFWDDIKVFGITILPAGGHSLAPYRFDEPNSTTANVYVYDSNKPGDNDRKIEFDLTNDTWKYVAEDLWGIPIITLEGDSSKCQLQVAPLELYRHQGIAWWAQIGWPPLETDAVATSTYTQVYATSGPARLLFTDDEGRRLGWDGINFYDDIPGASYIPMATGELRIPDGFYYISPDVSYSLQLYGYSTGQASVDLWGDSYMVQLSGLDVISGTVISVEVPDDGRSIKVWGASNETQGSLSVNRLLDGEDYNVSIRNLEINPGEETTLIFNVTETLSDTVSGTVILNTNSPISRTYDLSMQRSGGDGYSPFGNTGLNLDASSDAYIEVSNWSTLDEVTVMVDLDQNGFIDESRIASNEVTPSAIYFETPRTTIHTGGQQVDIIVAVRDQFGAYVTDGTPVSISSTLGTLSEYVGNTSGGLIYITLISGSEWGTANITVTVDGTDVEGIQEIEIIPYSIYLPTTLR